MATVIPNRIVLISHGRYDEAPLDADAWPGMMLRQKSNGNIIPHDQPGQTGPLLILIEDALIGNTIKVKQPGSQNTGRFYRPVKGDLFLMLLQKGQNVAAAADLMSAGDGTLVAGGNTKLSQIVAPSSVITNTAVETAFSNGTFTFPANSLQVGDVIHIRSKAFVVAENGTDTHRLRLYLGTAPITLADSTALQLAANDVVIFDLYLTVRTIGATGTVVTSGTMAYTISGTTTTKVVTGASATLDSTVAEVLVLKSLASAANVGNQIRLDEFLVENDRTGGVLPVVRSAEAIDNSGNIGTSEFNNAAFIRCFIP